MHLGPCSEANWPRATRPLPSTVAPRKVLRCLGRLRGSMVAIKGSFGRGPPQEADGVSTNSIRNVKDFDFDICPCVICGLLIDRFALQADGARPDIVSRRRRRKRRAPDRASLLKSATDDGSTGVGLGANSCRMRRIRGQLSCNGIVALSPNDTFFDANRKRVYATGERLSSCLTLASPIAQWRA